MGDTHWDWWRNIFVKKIYALFLKIGRLFLFRSPSPERRIGGPPMRYLPVSRDDFGVDWEKLLHPAAAFDHPRDVVNDPDLTRHEKRAILSSWASDASAVESFPGLRQLPGTKAPVSFDEIVEALKSLDKDDPTPPRPGGSAVWPAGKRGNDPDGWNGAPF
jgi:hypothetical protein